VQNGMLYIPISMIRKYAITIVLQDMETDFWKNAKTCRPRSDLGLHFFANLNFDGFRGLNAIMIYLFSRVL
jgi:hypothetical protein